MSEPRMIPTPVQIAVRELAERAEYFVEASKAGSWVQLETWLHAMKPRFDMLLDVAGNRRIHPAARMTITEETMTLIESEFEVPDSLEGEKP